MLAELNRAVHGEVEVQQRSYADLDGKSGLAVLAAFAVQFHTATLSACRKAGSLPPSLRRKSSLIGKQ